MACIMNALALTDSHPFLTVFVNENYFVHPYAWIVIEKPGTENPYFVACLFRKTIFFASSLRAVISIRLI